MRRMARGQSYCSKCGYQGTGDCSCCLEVKEVKENFMDEENELNWSLQSISSLLGSKKAFINSKGDVDVGDVKEVTVCEEGVLKVKIKGEKTATVCMEAVFEDAKKAYRVSIKLKDEQKKNLDSDISAMKGRIDNLDNPPIG